MIVEIAAEVFIRNLEDIYNSLKKLKVERKQENLDKLVTYEIASAKLDAMIGYLKELQETKEKECELDGK